MKKGFTLVESIIYVAILTIFSVLILNVIVLFGKSWSVVKANKNVNVSAMTALERITRDVRSATSVAGSSVLGTTPGTLDINVKDQSGASVVQSFYISNGKLFTRIGSGAEEQLTLSSVTVQSLTFYKTLLINAEAVKIVMVLTTVEGDKTETRTVETTTTLRGGY